MLTRDEILARKTGVEKFTLPDGSGEVEIRGITHAQAAEVGAARNAEDATRATALIIRYGMVTPELSADDVDAWMAADDAGTLELVAQAIGRLSRIIEGAGKSGVPKTGRRPRS